MILVHLFYIFEALIDSLYFAHSLSLCVILTVVKFSLVSMQAIHYISEKITTGWTKERNTREKEEIVLVISIMDL